VKVIKVVDPKSERGTQFNNKTAIISGGAEGIGLGMAIALGHQGMNIVLGDIDAEQLGNAESRLKKLGINVLAVVMDVTNTEHWEAIADQTIERFGKIHMLVNNAGVATAPGPIEATNQNDWRWVMDVNLMGVVTGTHIIIPHIKQHGEGGWLINTSSMAGLSGVPYAGAYTASKVAVVGMSEAWQAELAGQGIKVSVLCPGFVKTRIHLSQRNRLDNDRTERCDSANQDIGSENIPTASLVENGIPAELVGKRVVEALQLGEFYIFTHPSYRAEISKRASAIDQAFERAANSPLLADIVDQELPSFS
jgi:NAD(P)-dependent dehydrogenase (short-subunit alcohol dehydrogenase family)